MLWLLAVPYPTQVNARHQSLLPPWVDQRVGRLQSEASITQPSAEHHKEIHNIPCPAHAEWCGSGFEAVGNRVHNTRGRGVLSKASRALIADNTFTHLKGRCSILCASQQLCA